MSSNRLHRRELLIGAGTMLAAPLFACAPERPAAHAPGRLIAGDTCPVTPRQTEGPFYFDPHLVRQDISEGRPGVPLRLRLQLVDAVDCSPSRRARVDVWHSDAGGIYSGSDLLGTTGQTFLRGTQFADAQGVVEFHTHYPGWYAGRTPHMHVKAWLADGRELTSQVYFPDALSDRIYAEGPYAGRSGPRLGNGEDLIFRAAGDHVPLAAIRRGRDGLDGAVVLALG